MNRKHLAYITLISIAITAFIALPAVSHAEDPLIFGIYPFLSATELYKHFNPLADHLGRELGRPVKIINETDYTSLLNKIKKGKVDIAFLGPAGYVSYTKQFGRIPLLAAYETNGSKTFKGYIAVKKDGPITKLSQLKGKKFAFGDVKSTMGHIVPRYMLLKAGVDLKQLGGHKFLDNQENVALGVLSGNFDAGAIRENIYDQYSGEGLRAVATSDLIADHLFVARAGLPDDTVRKISQILLSLKDKEEGRRILDSMQKNLTALVTARDADYDSLRKILDYLARAGLKL